MEEILKPYLPAMTAYVRKKRGVGIDTAEDLVQGFVTQKIVQNDLLLRADASRGRFRSLLLTALHRYLASDYRNAMRRQPTAVAVPFEESIHSPIADDEDAHTLDVEWARQVLQTTLAAMKQECDAHDRQFVWNVFDLRVLSPSLQGDDPVPYDQIVREFGFRSPTQAANVLITAKRLFTRHLQRTIKRYLMEKENVDDEIRELSASLLRDCQ